MPQSLVEDLAWSLVQLAGEEGLGNVTIRSLAGHTRVSPGTISNRFVSKQELWAICTSVIGRWLAQAAGDIVDDRGAVGLFPTGEDGDRTYRLLASAWAQLRALALTDPAVDDRLRGVTPLVTSAAARACQEPEHRLTLGASMCLEALRQEVVRPGTTLTAESALEAFQEVEPAARREALRYDA